MERVIENKDEFKAQAIQIHKDFPSLKYSTIQDGSSVVSGELILEDEYGNHIDSYKILITPKSPFPTRFPFVYETGGRIPVNIDWHVFADGHCCIKSIPDEILICRKGFTLKEFIENEVTPYFFNQKFRETNGYFLNERSHGIKGNIEFFQDVFKTKDSPTIIRNLLFIKERTEPNRVSLCFCGSGEKYRNCHRDGYRLINKFSDEELNFFIKMLTLRPMEN